MVDRGLAPSREKAKALIMAGQVYVQNQKSDKPGTSYTEAVEIEVRGSGLAYVSRGGLKLEKAMRVFPIRLQDKTAMDIGASTGGFTDCMLQNGAKKVYAVDVGYGQLAWKLRTDPRVVCMERTNIRYVTPDDIGELTDFASIDVSFISLKKIMPATINLLSDKGEVVALIKPQFEAGKEKVGKKGVVRDINVHNEVVKSIVDYLLSQGLNILALSYSPIKGPEGNIEYLVYFTKDKDRESKFSIDDVEIIVDQSHNLL